MDTSSIAQAEIKMLQGIVEQIDHVFYANTDKLDGVDLNRLSTARAQAAFLMERARRREMQMLARS